MSYAVTGAELRAAMKEHFVDLLRWRAQHQPDQRAYLFLADGETEEQSLTYGELGRQARLIAAELGARHLAGERVLLLCPPGLAYISAFWGCLCAGAIAVPPCRRVQPGAGGNDQRLSAFHRRQENHPRVAGLSLEA